MEWCIFRIVSERTIVLPGAEYSAGTLVYCYDQAISSANGIVGVGVFGRDAFHLFQAVLTRCWGVSILAGRLFI